MMTKRINILDPIIFNKISAGEVVERPASVVKELIENSLDAGASEISVEIREGGLKFIRVSDNGSGIEKDDLKKAFLPHATSKISSSDDLENISTLGFRGEAIPSIASISKTTIVSKTKNSLEGKKIEVCGGKLDNEIELSSPNGTFVTVQNLFYNTPARLKFLKKPKSEENEITSVVSKFILANKDVSFQYIVDDKLVFKTTENDLKERIQIIFGKDVAASLLKVDAKFTDFEISGYIGKPEIAKANRTSQNIFVNSRFVQNLTVSSAVESAFDDYLMKGQHPVFILFLKVPFDKVDVNVHPSKLQVKFENNQKIYSNVSFAISDTLQKSDLSQSIPLFEKVDDLVSNKVKLDFSNYEQEIRKIREDVLSKKDTDPEFNFKQDLISEIIISQAIDDKKTTDNKEHEITEQTSFFSKGETIEKIGVFFDTYIAIQKGENIYLIDQHAAHERLLYDRLQKSFAESNDLKQNLLVPYVFDVNNKEEDFINENLDCLKELGFEIEEFGNSAFKVSSVPYPLASINLKSFFMSILTNLNSFSKKKANLLKDELAKTACKAAVKGGDKLSENEIETLISKIENENTTPLCPHGRPFILKISKIDVEKMFKRIV